MFLHRKQTLINPRKSLYSGIIPENIKEIKKTRSRRFTTVIPDEINLEDNLLVLFAMNIMTMPHFAQVYRSNLTL